MKVLGIETSCDETAVAVYDSECGLLADELHSQVILHAKHGGVVPELASRDHANKLAPLIDETMRKANITYADLDGIAYTAGPGLVGALMVGACFSRSLGFGLGIPTIAIHHMEGHLLAPMLEEDSPSFPFLALLVSGGHTLLVHVEKIGQYKILGQSLDDAAGEAFDKTARLLGLPYPGGPQISAFAERGDPTRFEFPRPMTNRPGLDFSFSGLKTFTMNTWQQSPKDEQTKADIAYAFQKAVIDTLVIKCRRGLKQTGLKNLVIAGGVSSNHLLRKEMESMVQADHAKLFLPRLAFCTDNGAMIAYAGYQRLIAGQQDGLSIQVYPRWSMETLMPVNG